MEGNIIVELGLQDLPEEKRLKLLEDMAELVERRTMIRLIGALNEADTKTANDLAEDPERLLAFLASKGDVGRIAAEETEKLKVEMAVEASDDTPIEEA